MAISSFVTAFMLEHCPLSTGSYLISTSYVVQNILQFSNFLSFICIYLILLYVKDYDIFPSVSCFGVFLS